MRPEILQKFILTTICFISYVAADVTQIFDHYFDINENQDNYNEHQDNYERQDDYLEQYGAGYSYVVPSIPFEVSLPTATYLPPAPTYLPPASETDSKYLPPSAPSTTEETTTLPPSPPHSYLPPLASVTTPNTPTKLKYLKTKGEYRITIPSYAVPLEPEPATNFLPPKQQSNYLAPDVYEKVDEAEQNPFRGPYN